MSASSRLIAAIRATDPTERDRPLSDLIAGLDPEALAEAADDLDAFRQGAPNLYERVRAAMFLHAIHRYGLQESGAVPAAGHVPFEGFEDLLERRFEPAIARFAAAKAARGLDGTLASALAHSYEQIALQTLADQVRRSVRGCAGNRWMFRVGQPDENPARLRPELFDRPGDGPFPILVERTPVRLDLSHSGWSDIFFLGMDYPEGARVLNLSVDLAVYGRDAAPRPPIAAYCRVIAEPVLRLTSLDLNACKDVATLEELFNFGNDYLGLIKAGVIASGLVPPSLEGTGASLSAVLRHAVRPGHGLEIVSAVNDIPKGSRLAVSTNLLAALIAVLMRATGQARNLTGPLAPEEARVVVARAILGEWLGGSGGGWQDSGGVFPGAKLIRGVPATKQDPEWDVSRGRLLPEHVPLEGADALLDGLNESLVLVHGGMAQNVGPILNMVSEKYLLRTAEAWEARGEALRIFEAIVAASRRGDIKELGRLTTANWEGPLKAIIPWVTNAFTERLIADSKAALGADFWGFLMLGGMSGGGMGIFVAPHRRAAFRDEVLGIMARAKADLEDALPFAMEPVVYDFAVNRLGTSAETLANDRATMPPRYYTLQVPRMIAEGQAVAEGRKRDVGRFVERHDDPDALLAVFRATVHDLFPVSRGGEGPAPSVWDRQAEAMKRANGFDPKAHAALVEDYRRGRIDLARNRLPIDTDILDVLDSDVIPSAAPSESAVKIGAEAIADGQVAVVSLAAGVGSRWTGGAGVVKAINPFAVFEGRHRSFLEVHLAKTARARRRFGAALPHVVTTSFLTHDAIARHLSRTNNYGQSGPVVLSPGQSIGQRLVPTVRSLNTLWDETAHERLDENKQKVRDASRRAILEWAQAAGEGSDYVDNLPLQRFHPPGHFYEVPNLLRNGTLARLLNDRPNLRWLMVHNIDTLGADVDPGVLGLAIEGGGALTFEVVPRRIEDRGGGLARVNGRVRLLEGLAVPREEAEFRLRYYNTLTSWVEIDGLLAAFGLSRSDLADSPKVAAAVRALSARVPTYATIKDVKRRWGHGQEDVFPVAQFEKLWGDLTALPDLDCRYLAVGRPRGQQLKDVAQLDGWARDGSRDYVAGLCDFAR